ncbi:hypothetical protein C7121_13315 [Paenibacillus glucanolyticus]|jgi:hypothetical protein|uniref:hypothetical protein n=1 Tax=Paenibacillus glucanolyticus TaxID=59843 RepID=UPI000D1B1F18|nr:hypothetical protein [Paenibacillus glucanolyticus]AVV57015.1 hypothetical protein C7121_13315 [Paenibacillus glucanolyticus]
MNEEKESFEYLVEYLEKYIAELSFELDGDSADLFLQGKIKGVQHALKFVRIHAHAGKNNGQFVDVIID